MKLFAIVSLLAFTTLLVPVRVEGKRQDSVVLNDLDNDLVTGLDYSSRRKREPEDAFISKSEQMSMVARVITGITLRSGLADKSIPGDEALAEMLGIGSVRMDDLEKFDKSKVDAFFSNIQSLAATGSTEVTNFEKAVMLLEEWRHDFVALGNLNETSVMDGYFGKVAQFNSSGLDSKSFGKMISNISRTVTLLEEIETLPDDTDTNHAQNDKHSANLKELRSYVQLLVPLVSTIDGMHQVLKTVESLAEDAVVRSEQFRFVQLVDDYFIREPELQPGKANNGKQLSDLFTATATLSADLDASKSDQLIFSAIDSAMNPKGKMADRKHTAGFVNGFSDLQTLSSDVQNQWLKSTIKGFDPDVIGSGLAPLDPLYKKSKEVTDKWKTMAHVHETVERAAKAIETFGDVNSVAATAEKSISKIRKCGLKPSLLQDVVLKASEIVTRTVQFQRTFSFTIRILNTLKQRWSLKEMDLLSKLNESISFSSDYHNHSKELSGIIANVKAFTGTKDLIRVLNETLPTLTELQKAVDGDPLNTLASGIASASDEVKTFLDGAPASQLIKFFQCPSNISTEMTSVVKAISVLRRIRSLQANTSFVADIGTATTAISESIPLIGQLRSTATLQPDTHFQHLGSLRGSSKPFGDAVTALWMIRKVLEKNSSVEVLVDKAQVVDSEIAMVPDDKLRKSIEKAWGDSEALKKSLEAMRNSLKVAMAVVRRRRQSASGLDPFKKLFTSVSGLQDIPYTVLDVERKLGALDELLIANPTRANDVRDVQKALEDVGSLDLQFSRFSSTLSAIAQTLDDISLAFASSLTKTTKTPAGGVHLPSQGTPGSAPIVGNQSLASPPVSTSTQKEVRDGKTKIIVISLIVLGILLLCAAAYFVYRRCFLYRKYKREMATRKRLKTVQEKSERSKREKENAIAATERLKQEAEGLKEENLRLRKKETKNDKEIRESDAKVAEAVEKQKKAEKQAENEKQNVENAVNEAVALKKQLEEMDKKCAEAVQAKEKEEEEKLELIEKCQRAIAEKKEPNEVIRNLNEKELADIFNALKYRTDSFTYFTIPRDGTTMVSAHFTLALIRGKRPRKLYDQDFPHKFEERLQQEKAAREKNWLRANFVDGPKSYDSDKIEFAQGEWAIAAKSPEQADVHIFWGVIWDNGVTLLIQLEACAEYFNSTVGEYIDFGPFRITTTAHHTDNDIEEDVELKTWTLKLQLQDNLEKFRTVSVKYIMKWVDNASVSKDTRVVIQDVYGEVLGKNAFLVHCSDGAKRTGTFIGCKYFAHQILKYKKNCSLVSTIRKLQVERHNAIGDGAQLLLMQNIVLAQMIKNAGLDENHSELGKKMTGQWVYYENYSCEQFNKDELKDVLDSIKGTGRFVELIKKAILIKIEDIGSKLRENNAGVEIEPTQYDES